MFKVRAVIIDYYISKPIAELYDKNELNDQWLEPVIRIFGCTPKGLKTCVHIHGVYPYMYVPYKGGDNPNRDALILGAALDEALKITYNQRKSKFIHKVTITSGIPLYGYHSSCRQFFKIFFYNPFYIRKSSDLLLNGAVLGQKLQPHEAHIPYVLQFMIDYNIYGMSFVEFSKVKYRINLENRDALSGIVGTDAMLSDKVKKMTCSYLEVDVLAADITNRHAGRGLSANPGLRGIWENEKIRRREQNLPSQFTVEESLSRKSQEVHPAELMYKERLADKLKDVPLATPVRLKESHDDPELVYPAEVPASSNLLEASAFLDDVDVFREEAEDNLADISIFINEKILTQKMESEKEEEEIEEKEEIEPESILGKNRKEGGEEGAEPENEGEEEDDEDGGDMTQPLEPAIDGDSVSNAQDPQREGFRREKFWRIMADKILQIDGAEDSSSSDSDADSTLRKTATGSTFLLEKPFVDVNSSKSHQAVGNESIAPSGTPPAPANTILTFLTAESPPASVPLIISQPLPGTWSAFSPRIDCSLIPLQETWSWDKSEISFTDFLVPKGTHVASGCDFSETPGINNSKGNDSNSSDSLRSLLGSNQLFDNYSDIPSLSPCSNIASTYSDSSPASVFPSPNGFDTYADINMNSISEGGGNVYVEPAYGLKQNLNFSSGSAAECNGNAESQGSSPGSPRVEGSLREKTETKCLNVLNNNSSSGKKSCGGDPKKPGGSALALKEYFKDYGDVVSVEVKNFNNHPMVVVEYKPLSGANKFLIRPVEGFLDNNLIGAEKKPKENLSLRKEKIKTGKIEKLKIKIGKISESANGRRRKSADEESSKSGKTGKGTNKRKAKNSEVNTNEKESEKSKNDHFSCRCHKSKKIKAAEVKSSNSESNFKKTQPKKKLEKLIINNWKGEGNQSENKISNLIERTRREVEENDEEQDVRLISQINSSFEEYFKKIVKVNNNSYGGNAKNFCPGKNESFESNARKNENKRPKITERKVEDDKEEDDEEEEEDVDEEYNEADLGHESHNPRKRISGSGDSESVKIITQLLSALSKMSQTREMPPLHITINIGGRSDCQTQQPACVNSEDVPSKYAGRERERQQGKNGKLKKFKVPTVDGTGDGSSSEDSVENPSERPALSRKRAKKEVHYKSLNIVLHKPEAAKCKKSTERKRKRSVQSPDAEGKDVVFGHRDSFVDYSENKLKNDEETPKPTVSSGKRVSFDATNSSTVQESKTSLFLKSQSQEEPDIIYDSDDGISLKAFALMKRKSRRKSLKIKSRKDAAAENRPVPESIKGSESEGAERARAIGETSCEATPVDAPPQTQVPVPESPCFQLDVTSSPFDKSLSELDKTMYRIPGKWFSEKSVERDSTDQLSHGFVVKENSNDSFSSSYSSLGVMPLSGSPLCGSAGISRRSSTRRDSSEDNVILDRAVGSESPKVEMDSSAGSCDTLKPGSSFLREESTSPRNSYFSSEFHKSHVISLDESKVIQPCRKPPTWNQVRSFVMANRHIKEKTQAPFYSDFRDVTKAMEAGPLTLKVETIAYAGLKTFKSSLNLLGSEERRSLLLKAGKRENVRHLLLTDRIKMITPLKKPPSTLEVIKSLESIKVAVKPADKSKKKMFVPMSPGQESHSEEEIEMSLSESTLKEEGEGKTGCSGSKIKSSDSDLLDDRVPQSQREKSSKNESKYRIPSDSNSSDACRSDLMMIKEGKKNSDISYQIRGPTLENTFGFDNSVENLQDVKVGKTYQHVTMLVMEVHVETRKDLRPDPQHDPIRAIFYTVTFDSPDADQETGVVVAGDLPLRGGFRPVQAFYRAADEMNLILKLIDLVKNWDPDILAGYEIEMHSWGYLIQRGHVLGMNLLSVLGRILADDAEGGKISFEKEEFDDVPSSIKNMRISGRIVLDIWRVLRHEVALTSYTFENVIYHLSQERHPLLSYKELSFYWQHPSHRYRFITLDYYVARVNGIVQILDRLDFINRTSEFARLFGIQFYEVLSRGSQFRVESMMLRLAKPLNYVAVSPSSGQRAAMRAPASLPLILEPESAFYTDPLIVLDFQSLYPSMIIAYNYCFSTCLGRIEKLGGLEPFEFGCTRLQISPEELKVLEKELNISPAGVAFVKETVRKGILPTMLEEILETRLMVKKSMKNNKGNKLLLKVLHAQQLGLKLIANVTYGYTAANFSGRMPSIEVGDSVVSKGRETLHRAIQLIKNNPDWNARVVYGDTDSVFVLTPGRSRAEAFQIGTEIAEAVTRDNPKPVKLKLEKIYQPSILQTKKRYVGYMYENPDQVKPTFEAKGIETVRRDGCPVVGKILQKALQILFETRDVSLVKKYTIRQFSKLFQGRVNVQDLIFAKEYRGRNGYRPGACVPALQLARQWTSVDKRAEPRVKERVPYVIVNGPPGVPLIKLVRSPMDLISDSGLHVNVFYYITKAIIPPLHRCFSLLGVDVASWYSEMPKKYEKRYRATLPRESKKSTISQYFATVECMVCSAVTPTIICKNCRDQNQASTLFLMEKIRHWEKCSSSISQICQSCCKSPTEFDCQSLDCPVLFRKIQATRDLLQVPTVRRILDDGLTTEEPFSFSPPRPPLRAFDLENIL